MAGMTKKSLVKPRPHHLPRRHPLQRVRLSIVAAWTTLAAHIVCCISPMALAVFNLLLGAEIAFELNILGYGFEEFMFVIAGLLILASYTHEKITGRKDPFLPLVVVIHCTALTIYFLMR
ncbi:MAG: hypothetical protein FWD15_02265 [Alphaproteobacteria bacterium]|nr:hypothetical protein [Alphaproteobacteria bacterium]